MQLILDEAALGVVRDVLDTAARDLRYEIADTDNAEFKHGLEQRAEVLRSVIDQLGGTG